MKLNKLIAVSLLTLAAPSFAATPASGELTEASEPIAYSGGPFVASNPSGDAADPVCAPDPAGLLCDSFALTVNVSDEFRADEANKKEVISIAMSFAQAADDFDLYVYDGSGALIAEAAGGSGVQETVTLPLAVLKNGDYTITVAPYLVVPGDGYDMAVKVGRPGKQASVAAKSGSGLVAGGFGLAGLLGLMGFAALRRHA